MSETSIIGAVCLIKAIAQRFTNERLQTPPIQHGDFASYRDDGRRERHAGRSRTRLTQTGHAELMGDIR
ncbi:MULTISPECIES: hypothetical protein [Sphingomonas]|uniref:hypothetical protein n=1 Tax=Sphingomonas TaxID=13687 RepID=UPI001404AFAC|nr:MULTISPECIES: hypothetical protein [Sphingomonas]